MAYLRNWPKNSYPNYRCQLAAACASFLYFPRDDSEKIGECGTKRDTFQNTNEVTRGTQVAEERELFAEWLDGHSLRQIARSFAMSRMAVSRLARKHRWLERRERLNNAAEKRIASEYERLALRLCRTHALFAELHERLVQKVQEHLQTLVEKNDDREIIKFSRGRTVQCLLGDHAKLLEAFIKLFGRTDRTMEQALELRRSPQSLEPQKDVASPTDERQGSYPPNLGLTSEQFNEFARWIVERSQGQPAHMESSVVPEDVTEQQDQAEDQLCAQDGLVVHFM